MAINGRSRKKVFHEQLEEDAVEDTWRRRHRPLMNTALDNFGVESVRNNFRPRRIPQLSGTSRMILMCMGEKNPIEVPGSLSFRAYGTFQSYVHGLDEYPKDTWPDNIELSNEKGSKCC